MSKKKKEQKLTNKDRIAELEHRVDALTAALWEVTKLSLVSTSDSIPAPKTEVALAGTAGIAIKLQDGGMPEPQTISAQTRT
jgi:hypothetical protein